MVSLSWIIRGRLLRVFYFYGAGIFFDIGDETHIEVSVGRVLEWFEREGIYT